MANTTRLLVPKRKAMFLEVFRQNGNFSESAKASGSNRNHVYTWLKNDEKFKAAFDEAKEEAGDALEQEARRRAVEGVEEPVFHKGEVCGYVQRYSDTLLIFLLKGCRPEKYRESFAVNATAVAAVTGKDTEEELREALEKVLSRGENGDAA